MLVKAVMVTNVVMQDEEFRRALIAKIKNDLVRKGMHPRRVRFAKVAEPKSGKHFQPKWQNYYIEVIYD